MVYDVKFVKTFRELLDTSAEEYFDKVAFIYRDDDGTAEITYKQARDDVRALSSYLCSLGLSGEKIMIIGSNCYGWAISYLAVCCGVGVAVPTDKELKGADIENIIKMTSAAAVICTDDMLPALEGVDIKKLPLSQLEEYLYQGRRLIKDGDRSYEEHKIDPDGLSVLIYTSGTSGAAKGVMLSQFNICSNIIAVRKQVIVTPEDRVMSVLPLHHTYECMAGFLSIIYSGGSISYATSLRKMVSDMQYYKPTVFVTVPLIMETIYGALMKKATADRGKRLKFKAAGAITKTLSAVHIDVRGKIYSEIHAAFGGRLRAFLCGAAPLDGDLSRAYTALGFDVFCGYGLTETSPVLIMHNDFYKNPDTSGKPICGVSVKINEPDESGVGELIVKSSSVMLGYYNDPEATAQVIRDGWFYTGDLGRRNKDGSYTVVGRKKSMIVTQNGKKILPEELEYRLNESKLIKEALVFGGAGPDGATVVFASVFPDYEELDGELKKRGTTPSYSEYYALLRELVREVNAQMPGYKRIYKLIMRKNEFIKTSSRKIKRTEADNLRDE